MLDAHPTEPRLKKLQQRDLLVIRRGKADVAPFAGHDAPPVRAAYRVGDAESRACADDEARRRVIEVARLQRAHRLRRQCLDTRSISLEIVDEIHVLDVEARGNLISVERPLTVGESRPSSGDGAGDRDTGSRHAPGAAVLPQERCQGGLECGVVSHRKHSIARVSRAIALRVREPEARAGAADVRCQDHDERKCTTRLC